MKNLFFSVLATMMVGIFGNAQTTKTVTSDQFFSLILEKSATVTAEKVLYVTYDFNFKTKTYSNCNFEIKEPNFFVIALPATAKKAYTVTCMKGNKTLWTNECDGKFACGTMIYDCLQAGGCATICTNKLAYLPQTKDLVLLHE